MKEAASSTKRLWNDLEKSVLDRVNLHMLMIGKTPNSPHLTALFQGLVMERLRLRLRGKPATIICARAPTDIPAYKRGKKSKRQTCPNAAARRLS